MTKDQILKKVNDVFCDVFRDPSLNIDMKTTADDIPGWTSLTHMHLIASIEDRFKCEFSFSEVVEFSNAGDMIEKLAEKLQKEDEL